MYQTVTLAGTYRLPDGSPAKGTVEIIPSEKVIIDSTGDVILSGRVKVQLDETGSFSVALPATDDPTLNPTGFGYTVSAKLHHQTIPAVSFSLPAALGTVDIADLTFVDPSTFTPGVTYVTPSELDAAVAGVVVDTSGLATAADVDALEGEVTGRLSEASLSGVFGVVGKPASTQFAEPIGVGVMRQDSVYNYLTWSRDGSKIIARDLASPGGRNVASSSDNGATWTRGAAPDAVHGPNYAWTTASGALLLLAGPNLYRSTDNGAAFTLALALGSGETILDGALVQTTDGTLYAGVYSSGGAGTWYASGAPVYRSTDDGVTWAVHSTFPSTMKGASGTSAIRHIHGMLAVGNDLWCATGDSAVESGIWKYETGAWVRKSPLDVAGNGHRFCAVSLIERGGYLYWALDTNADDPGLLMRAPLTDIGAWEELADLPTSSYYSTKMPDGTLLFGGSIEVGTGGYQDDTLRIWAVDEDDRVSLAWAGALHKDGSGNRPVGALRAHPTNGTAMFTAKMMVDYSDPTLMWLGSYLGNVRKGLPVAVTPTPVKRSSAFVKVGTVVDPSVASSTLTTFETLNIDLKGRTCLVIWSGTFSGNIVGARITVGPAMDGGTVNTTDQRSAMVGTAWHEFAMSGTALLTFGAPGKHTVDLKMSAASGSAYANSVKRSLVVIELG